MKWKGYSGMKGRLRGIMRLFRRKGGEEINGTSFRGTGLPLLCEEHDVLGDFSLERLRRIRSLEGDLTDLGFDIYDVKLLKARSSKSFFK